MACPGGCGPKVQGQCDACKLVDGDERFKPVFFCTVCNAYLCADCLDNYGKRTGAAIIRLAERASAKIDSYIKLKLFKKKDQ